jgi:hypothetical protein
MIDLRDPAAMLNAVIVDHRSVLRVFVFEIEIIGGVLLVAFAGDQAFQFQLDQKRCLVVGLRVRRRFNS